MNVALMTVMLMSAVATVTVPLALVELPARTNLNPSGFFAVFIMTMNSLPGRRRFLVMSACGRALDRFSKTTNPRAT